MDNLDQVWDTFFSLREMSLWDKYKGCYLAEVVETNDPLIMGRLRIRIPELHDRNLKPDDCQWAEQLDGQGDKGAGIWKSINIGDIVLVMFQKNHPYAPVWFGSASPTRRRSYPLPSIHTSSPISVKTNGEPDSAPDDFIKEYLPKDGRPMSSGIRDRYGNVAMLSAVGYFPTEHDVKPAPNGTDSISKSQFEGSQEKPIINDPDMKFCTINTKYGNMMLLSDIGFAWNKEFTGDFDKDQQFESDRNKYFIKLISENKATGFDQRRFEVRTRYGHKLEFRDVGWRKTRKSEYTDDIREISSETVRDERWIKLKTKAGFLLQAMDIGADPEKNVNVLRLLKDEVGATDDEDKWGKDARQVRIVSPYGIKLAIDDRGSDPVDPINIPTPGNGIIMKGRRGYGLEFNEKSKLDRFMIYTPKSQGIELNDKFDYVMMCTAMSGTIAESWMGTKDNEFAKSTFRRFKPEADTFHLLLDKANRYSRHMTPMQQGVEMHDSSSSGTWTQLRDSENRGIWMSKDRNYAIWRNKSSDIYIVLDDGSQSILLRNNSGKIQIFAGGDVDVISGGRIGMTAHTVSIKASDKVVINGGSGQLIIDGAGVATPNQFQAATHIGFFPQLSPGPGATNGGTRPGPADDLTPMDVSAKAPDCIGRECSINEPAMSQVVDQKDIAGPG